MIPAIDIYLGDFTLIWKVRIQLVTIQVHTMAALTEVVTQVPILAPSKDYCTINSTNATLEKINSITDLIAYQAQNIPDVVLIAYPYPDDSISDFADFTAKELDHYADQVAKELSRQGLRPSVSLSVQ